jgi:hypothetical protein
LKKSIARQLVLKIRECEKQFSNPNRELNTNKETFKFYDIKPLSDSVAVVTLQKNTGKKTNAIFFYIKNYWIYFFPTDSHELGMWNYLLKSNREKIETENFEKNFEEKLNIENI